MSIDVIGIILAILFFIKGYSKGLIVALCSVIALLLGVVCAVSFSAKLALYLQDKGWASGAWAPLISYVVLFFAVLWGVRLLAKLIDNLGNTLLLGWANKLAGGLLYLGAVWIIYSSALWMCNRAHLIGAETMTTSRTYCFIEPAAPWFFSRVGRILPFAQHAFDNLHQFFDGVNQKLPEHVGTH
ncbi:MAG: CvpA family protein [Chitinophagaceae bacterium]